MLCGTFAFTASATVYAGIRCAFDYGTPIAASSLHTSAYGIHHPSIVEPGCSVVAQVCSRSCERRRTPLTDALHLNETRNTMSINPKPDESAVTNLRQKLVGTLAFPGEAGYELSAPWNQSVTASPAAVVAAANAEDIAAAVRWAASNGLRVAVQSTGHGAIPYVDDVLLIHTGSMQECAIDVEQRTARVGAGILSGQLTTAAAPFGLAPLVGTAGDVGFVGFLSGGGIGPMVAVFGLSSDHVRALDVVTGRGRSITSPRPSIPICFGHYGAVRAIWASSLAPKSNFLR